MKNIKLFYIVLLILICILKCEKKYEPLSSNLVIDKPKWLIEYIDEISKKNYYVGSIIYRHVWHSQYYYHVMIPVSSCAYCEVYDQSGNKVEWTEELFSDYLNNRKNEMVVWRWSN